ncbi:MAG: hypothetical protein NT160_00820, partial [Actinobacteria bacterium]|nr:hypothetical protein [Actinomycetota bacterium]
MLKHHYRGDWEWKHEDLHEAVTRFAQWSCNASGPEDAGVLEAVRAALDEDLNSPAAIQAIDEGARAGSGIATAAGLLGVSLRFT